MKKNILRNNTKGQGLVEYALIAVLVAMSIMLALNAMGFSLYDTYCSIAKSIGNEDACAGVYCQDDFSTYDNWTSQYGGWETKDGKLCTSRSAKNLNNCSQDMTNNKDYTVNLSDAQLDKGNGYGVFFRGTEMDGRTNGYIVQYDPGWGGGSIIMRKWVNGRELPPFAVKKMPGYDWSGEPHDMKLDVEGDTFTVYLDGEKVLVGQDSTYDEGGVGLRSWDSTEVCFGEFSIDSLVNNTGE